MFICNRFHDKGANNNRPGKLTTFMGEGYPSLMPACVALLEANGSRLGLLKSNLSYPCSLSALAWGDPFRIYGTYPVKSSRQPTVKI